MAFIRLKYNIRLLEIDQKMARVVRFPYYFGSYTFYEEKLDHKSPDSRYRIQRGRTENQPRNTGTHVWRHKCIKGPICNNIGPIEIWYKYQYLSYLKNKYSYSGQEDDRRITLFWRWRHFLIKYSEITLNQHPRNTVYEWISYSQIKQKNANDLSKVLFCKLSWVAN